MMRPKLQIVSLVFMSCVVISGCATYQPITTPKVVSHRKAQTTYTVGQPLINGFDEEKAGGVYCYLLWSDKIIFDLKFFSKALNLLFKSQLSSHYSGHLYWLLAENNPLAVEKLQMEKDWFYFIEAYHYQRAHIMLHRLDWTEQAAPVLVIGFLPLGTLAGSVNVSRRPLFLVDMSTMTNEEKLAVLNNLNKHILKKSVKYVKTHWSHDWLRNQLKLKTDANALFEVGSVQ